MCSLLLTRGICMFYFILSALILGADIITKIIAEQKLMSVSTIPIINNFFHLTYVENRGMAFGMFNGGRIFFVIITVIVLIALAIFILKTEKVNRSVWLKAGSACIIGGAVGNLIERVCKGYVVDFLDFRVIDFPVFNVADIAVCVGAAMLVIHFLRTES